MALLLSLPAYVEVYWNNPRTYLGRANPNANGTFAGTAAIPFTVPSTSPVGLDGALTQNVVGLVMAYFTVQ